MKLKIFFIIICNLLICNLQFAQNITSTLGTSGVFTIKDASNNYLTLSQSTGQVNILRTLRLANTTSSTTGVIYKGTDRFLHNYGTYNTFLGVNSGNFTMSGSFNTAVGMQSLYSNIYGVYNTGVGTESLYSNTDGAYNTAMGSRSLLNTTGFENTAVGEGSLYSNTTGNDNTAVGEGSLFSNTTGYENTTVGTFSLYSNNGYDNTAIGYYSGYNVTTGSNLTLIGYNAQPTTGSAINQITLGNSSITSLRCNVTTITSLSDARDKKNIKDLPLGLDFVMKLKPHAFNWDKREWYEDNVSDGSKMKETPTAGFIAQELDEVQTSENAEWLNLVLKDNPEKWEATPGNLLPIVVKAIQELKAENDELKKEIESIKNAEVRIAKLEQMILEINSLKEVKLTENKP